MWHPFVREADAGGSPAKQTMRQIEARAPEITRRCQGSPPVKWQATLLGEQLALEIAQEAQHTDVYQWLSERFPADVAKLYLERWVFVKIYPPIKDLCRKVHQLDHMSNRGSLDWSSYPDSYLSLGRMLRDVWPSTNIPLLVPDSLARLRRTLVRQRFWETAKTMRTMLERTKKRFAAHQPPRLNDAQRSTIAVHYCEGVDPLRRCDTAWFTSSGIQPERIVLFIDGPGHHEAGRIPDAMIREIERLGMRWVCVEHTHAVERTNAPCWVPPLGYGKLTRQLRTTLWQLRASDERLSWVRHAAMSLVSKVDYWTAFYQHFNVSIHFEPEEGYMRNIAQKVALERLGGIFIGRQRSRLVHAEERMLGHFPRHVFFCWGTQSLPAVLNGRNRVDTVIVSGFPHDAAIRLNAETHAPIRDQLTAKGARFCVSLFDNNFSSEGGLSKPIMHQLYETFLTWVVEVPDAGLVIKSQKPRVIPALPEIHALLRRAEATGRCIRFSDIEGRLPSDAAHATDLSVGVGISSAVIEAAIAGGRGIYWDPVEMWPEPLYRWGRDTVIFRELPQLMQALRQLQHDPTSHPEVGDHADLLDHLDPFRDGKAAERIGTYMCWLIEAVDAGQTRESAIRQANERYAALWGADKLLRVRGVLSSPSAEVLSPTWVAGVAAHGAA